MPANGRRDLIRHLKLNKNGSRSWWTMNSRVCRWCCNICTGHGQQGHFWEFSSSSASQEISRLYESDGSFPCSQEPTTWQSFLSTALKDWELIQRAKKDQRKRQNTEPVPIQLLSTAGGFLEIMPATTHQSVRWSPAIQYSHFRRPAVSSKSCLPPPANLSGDPPASQVSYRYNSPVIQQHILAQSQNLFGDCHDTPHASRRCFSLSHLQRLLPTPAVVIYSQNNTRLLSFLYLMKKWIGNSIKRHCTRSNAFHSIFVKYRCDVTTRILFFLDSSNINDVGAEFGCSRCN